MVAERTGRGVGFGGPLILISGANQAAAETNSLGLEVGVHYYAISNMSNPTIPVLRGKAGSQGYAHDLIILAPNTQYREWILHLQTMRVAVTNYTTPDVGRSFQLPEFQLRTSTSPDSDGDGLSDLAEFILGTNPNKADSDGDGIPDGVEILDGTDPLEVWPPPPASSRRRKPRERRWTFARSMTSLSLPVAQPG